MLKKTMPMGAVLLLLLLLLLRVVSYRGEELKSAQTRAHANTQEMRYTRRKKAVGDLASLKKRRGE